MIRKDDLVMANKKDLTIEELKQACEEAKQKFETLSEQLQKAQQEEEEKREAQLALEKEARKTEVDEAFNNYVKLLKTYIKDYGPYKIVTSPDDSDWFPNVFKSFF